MKLTFILPIAAFIIGVSAAPASDAPPLVGRDATRAKDAKTLEAECEVLSSPGEIQLPIYFCRENRGSKFWAPGKAPASDWQSIVNLVCNLDDHCLFQYFGDLINHLKLWNEIRPKYFDAIASPTS